jgi:arsenate reductase
MTTLYGLQRCSSCLEARAWLETHGIEYAFHDFRRNGLARDKLAEWVKKAGWEALLNKRGTTWRNLPENQRSRLNARSAQALMLEHPSLIKRPVLEVGAGLVVGYSSAQYEVAFEGAD